MATQFDIQVVLTEAEVRTALAQYVATKLGSGFSVHPSSIEFEVAAGQVLFIGWTVILIIFALLDYRQLTKKE